MKIRQRTLSLYGKALAVAMPLLMPVVALAATEDATELKEARFEGYAQKVALPEPGSNGLTWIVLVLLTILALSVLFKDAKRSHLD